MTSWLRRLRNKYHRAGCCPTCNGTGIDCSSPETNGRCWDCYGTGHCHWLSWWNQ